ncbi:MAG: orotate phosphoribosyltransferase [Candidatus Cloacimonetes bacterium]|nr:orotate phosphoribosyltransferase [Candidatus Cloacimonadota bacterium]
MEKSKIEELLIKSGAFLEGHFLLTSGKHSNQYVEKIKLVQNPHYVKKTITALKDKVKEFDFDTVVSPAMGAIVLGYELARQMEKRFVFTQRKNDKMTIRSGFDLDESSRVLIVEDVITTGGSVKEVIDCIEERKAQIKGIALVVDRSNGKASFNYPTTSLLQMDIENYEPNECPLCKKGIELEKPGASGKKIFNK